ncbi:MAG TPA: hypothetical protein VLL57_01475, partial [Candidatus Binataceae bacterium]|nr:hypothetical protein [Candidatus Binataceae bacterium]
MAGILLLSAAFAVGAQNSPSASNQGRTSPGNSIAAQPPGAAPSSTGGVSIQGGGEDATLEISPQPGLKPPSGTT